MTIYTKTGDKGETSLFGGKRVPKSEAQVDAYGSVDELNSWIGRVIAEITNEEKKEFLTKVQSDLLLLGGFLAGWKNDLAALATRVTEMEVEIDAMEKELPPLTNFILPGGTKEASTVHITRSVCRRVERKVVGLFSHQPSHSTSSGQAAFSLQPKEHDDILQYLNRLSDLLFVLARFINLNAGISDVSWSGIDRKE